VKKYLTSIDVKVTTEKSYCIILFKIINEFETIKEIPEEDEYKPPLNIKCICYGSMLMLPLYKQLESLDNTFAKKMLLGSCTIKSIGSFGADNKKLTQFCQIS
jgi:hypothetical protein